MRTAGRRSRSPTSRRVTSCTVDLRTVWYTPTSAAMETGTAMDTGRSETPFFGMESGLAPPTKTLRPEGIPEAEPPLAPYLPPPVEDDDIRGGGDDIGMAPEIVVNLEEKVEDPNMDLLTMDCQSDSPHPPSPRVVAALEEYTSNNVPPVEVPFDILHVVPSTQPVTPPPPTRAAARRLQSRSRRRVAGDSLLVPPTLTACVPPVPYLEERYTAGKGILHLCAPPKLARVPAPRRQPPPCADLPLPMWTIAMPPAPIVEYQAEMPEPTNHLPETPDAKTPSRTWMKASFLSQAAG